MKKNLNSNFIYSSNLLFGTFGIGILYLFLSKDILSSVTSLTIEVITLLIIVGLGLLVRQGNKWAKYVLIVLTLLFLIEAVSFLTYQTVDLTLRILYAIQVVLLANATVLLFRIPKQPTVVVKQ